MGKMIERDGILYEIFPFKFDINGSVLEFHAHIVGHSSDLCSDVIVPEMIQDVVVTNIDAAAFCNNTKLKRIKLPNSIANINIKAFQNCQKLKHVQSYPCTSANNTLSIHRLAFQNCHQLKSVCFLSKVEYVGESAFENCERLSSVDARLSYLERNAFANCTKLDGLVFENKAVWQTDAVKNCTSLETVAFLDTIGQKMTKRNLQKIKKLKIQCTSQFNYLEWMYSGTEMVVFEI